MSNQFLKLRRSGVPGKIPSTSSIDYGEIALNTHDGKAYMKVSGSSGIQVVQIGASSGSFSGSFTGTFSGSFSGSGANLFGIPASGIVGLNLSQISSGSYSASISEAGLLVNNRVVAPSFTGSLYGTASWALNALTASFVTASNVYGPYGANSILSASYTLSSSFAAFAESASYALDASNALTSSHALTASRVNTLNQNVTVVGNQTISGSLTITNNLTVLGSASVQYISESTLNIGTNLITVNTLTPSIRFGGLAIIDSGSSPLHSGSFLFDSENDQFIFVHQSAPITSSVFLLGPETYNNLGNETYLTQNRIPKGSGIEHLYDSNIYDDGNVIKTISGSTDIGLKLDFANNAYYLGDYANDKTIYYNSGNGDFEVKYGGGAIFSSNAATGNFQIGNNTLINSVVLDCDNSAKRLTTFYGNDNIGLKLDFANSNYQFGQLTGGNQTKITIYDPTNTVSISGSTVITGSLSATGLTEGSGSSHVIMYNTASGQFFFTASAAIGGGGGGGNASNDNFQQIFLLMGG